MNIRKHGCDVTLSVSRFIKAIEDLFHVYTASSKHSGSWENSRSYETVDCSWVCIQCNCLEFSQLPLCLDELCEQGKSIYYHKIRIYNGNDIALKANFSCIHSNPLIETVERSEVSMQRHQWQLS